jgi:CrcB protein
MVFLGGGLGSLVRYLLSKYTTSNFTHINPLGTLASNLLASLLLAVFIYFIQQKHGLSEPLKVFLVAGFCGGFSTFSTFSYETYELFKMGLPWHAVLNASISIALGVLIMFITSKLA